MTVKRLRKDKIIFIVGPTAIGKTRLSVKLAKRINGEIVSCDSMQVYRGMTILSQAPMKPETGRIKYHLVGFLDPRKEYSAAAFRKQASRIIKSILKRKKIPIVVGGSGLYVKALIDGLFPSPPADLKFRKRMQNIVSRHGAGHLHEKLAQIDPVAAGSIHPNDARRIIRALELYNSCGRTMTELKTLTKGLKDDCNIKIFGLTKPRDLLYKDINDRTETMFERPILDEVKKLRRKKLSKTANAVLGFKEITGYLKGEYDLAAAKSLLAMNTRRFAKRQMTWFRADRRIKWIDVSSVSTEKIITRICHHVTRSQCHM